jgi:hypothetical protein
MVVQAAPAAGNIGVVEDAADALRLKGTGNPFGMAPENPFEATSWQKRLDLSVALGTDKGHVWAVHDGVPAHDEDRLFRFKPQRECALAKKLP